MDHPQKVYCVECDWRGDNLEKLVAAHPFAPDCVVDGCPNCHGIDSLRKGEPMAGCDYRSCDVCGSKVFYDANLIYEQGTSAWGNDPIPKEEEAREAGVQLDYGYRLDYLGDWAVICRDCAKTHLTVVIPID